MKKNITAEALLTLTQIIQSAAKKGSVEEQINLILRRLCETLSVDVCSIYRVQVDGALQLIGSHGVNQCHPIIIPPKKGLVGIVLSNQQCINVSDPKQQPDYFYVAGSNEDVFRSFCGVPLIYRGESIGVLVVQTKDTVEQPPEIEAVLSTLAVHLALLVFDYKSNVDSIARENITHKGISGASGLAIGRALVQKGSGIKDAKKLKVKSIELELERWESVKEEVLNELSHEQINIQAQMGESLAAVFSAYQLILKDPEFDDRVAEQINRGFHIPWAVLTTIEYFDEQFMSMDDPYLKERAQDILQLGNKLYQVWQGSTRALIDSNNQPIVLVGKQISISAIAQLSTQKLVAITCLEGASLSHVAVFANALGIPAVMGLTSLDVLDNEPLVVDGTHGEVVSSPSHSLLHEYQQLIAEREVVTQQLLTGCEDAAESLDGCQYTVMANSGLQADVEPGLRFGADGIGLYRTEIAFMLRNTLPSEDEQQAIYQSVLERYQNKPVYLRTLDIGTDKLLPYLPSLEEENPALGLRGIRYSLDNQFLLVTQLRSAIKAAGLKSNLHILLPMVSVTEQLSLCMQLINSVMEELHAENQQVVRPKVGIMIEVPSCISMLPLWRDKLDFVSVGTNDLSQYLLAVDRNNPLVSKWYDPINPAVLHELYRLKLSCSELKLPVSVCGEMAADPIALLFLLGMGFNKFSMSAARIPLIKSLINHIRIEDTQKLLDEVLSKGESEQIRQLALLLLKQYNLPFKSLISDEL